MSLEIRRLNWKYKDVEHFEVSASQTNKNFINITGRLKTVTCTQDQGCLVANMCDPQLSKTALDIHDYIDFVILSRRFINHLGHREKFVIQKVIANYEKMLLSPIDSIITVSGLIGKYTDNNNVYILVYDMFSTSDLLSKRVG